MPQAVVTGGTGFVATELVHQLLAEGWDVRASVRSLNNEGKTKTLRALGDALPGKLELFEADLLKEGSFDAGVKGADYLFHTASPFFLEVKEDANKELIQPAVEGTLNVLRSAARSKDSLKRIVVTSSVASILGNAERPPPKDGKAYNENEWNETSTPETDPYPYSKVAAEKAATEFAQKEGLDLVKILPSFVMGPVLDPNASGASVSFMKGLLEGEASFEYPWAIDVRSIASAHILVAQEPSASGRYIVSLPGLISNKQIVDWLKDAFPDIDFPKVEETAADTPEFSSERISKLGLAFLPPRQTFLDMGGACITDAQANTIIQLGIANPKRKA